jgi:hypothetical protein
VEEELEEGELDINSNSEYEKRRLSDKIKKITNNNDSTDGQTPLFGSIPKENDSQPVLDFAYEVFDSLQLPVNMRTERNACSVLLLVQS